MKASIAKRIAAGTVSVGLLGLIACGTQQTANTFRPANKRVSEGLVTEKIVNGKTVIEYEVDVVKDVTTIVKRPVDLLFVIDNSSSMEPSQEKLRKALRGFAKTYLTPDSDIRIGAITTDAYLANPAFKEYLGSVLKNSQTKKNPEGLTFGAVHPTVGPSYAKLVAGIHDGPVVTMCTPVKGDFFNGPSRCSVRDKQDHKPGPDACIEGKNSIQECVNTINNNTVHSNRPIIHSKAPEGQNAEQWAEQVVRDFIVNVSVGTSGHGSERGLESIAQFIQDNETSDSRLFRAGSLKIIAILSDEDDQSTVIPPNPGSGFTAYSTYTDKCATKKLADFSYTLSTCVADESTLAPVESYKQKLDAYFQSIDGTTANYVVMPIVAKNGKTVQALQAKQRSMQNYGGKRKVPTDQDVGSRYIKLAELVGNGSETFDIGATDYGPILKGMFKKLVTQKVEKEKRTREEGTQELKRDVRDTIKLPKTPMNPEQVSVFVKRENGVREQLHGSQFRVDGKTVRILDGKVLETVRPADKFDVEFQPRYAGKDPK